MSRTSLRDLAERDGHLCWLCGTRVLPSEQSVDHLIPRRHGGTQAQKNLMLAHKGCNQARGALPYEDTLKVLADVPKYEQDFADRRQGRTRQALWVAHKAWIKTIPKQRSGPGPYKEYDWDQEVGQWTEIPNWAK